MDFCIVFCASGVKITKNTQILRYFDIFEIETLICAQNVNKPHIHRTR
jgi:hypothetical protein